MPLVLRMASDDDFRAFFGKEPPEVWNALAGVRDGIVVGIGGVTYSPEGVAVGFLDTTERPAMALHRAGLHFMSVMRKYEVSPVLTYCDGTIARANAWLERLGFKKTGDVIDGQDVWKWESASWQ